MKKYILYLASIVSIVSLLVSCDPDDNNPDGPVADPREKFVGSWNCNEASKLNGNSSYTVQISLNPNNSSQILLSNYYQLGVSSKVYAVVANNIASVLEQSAGGFIVKGDGTYSTASNKINWKYTVNDGADIDSCTAVYSK